VRRLSAERRFDYLLIEGTGIAEPLPVATTFSFRDEDGISLSDVARLDTMVTVVDAVNLLKDYRSNDLLRDRGETMGDGDERTLVDLLVEQIADVAVINKVSDVSRDELGLVRGIVKSLNADARIVETDFGQAELSDILDTGLFDEERASRHPLWAKELYGFRDHRPETEEYGIGSFVYRARPSFDPEKFNTFLGRSWPGLIRAKGHFWLATRPNWVGEYSLAGASARIARLGYWWAAVSKGVLAARGVEDMSRNPHWREPWGDRRQELVFIGTGIDETAICEALDACLVTAPIPNRIDARAYRTLRDPFPTWDRA
jgi:G3E family GTPase